MSFTLSMSGVIVGRSELETRDAGRRVASGAFRPGLGYKLAQPVFALYDAAARDTDALARYRNARDALRLQLTDSSGALVSVRELHIRRDSAASAAANALVIEVESDDPAFWASERHQ
jgi:hypothetical protein